MQHRYTYKNRKTGETKYSDTPLRDPDLQLVSQVRGGVPRGVAQKRQPLTTADELALYGPKV